MRERLIYFSVIYQGDYNKITKAISRDVIPDEKAVRQCLSGLEEKCVTILDEDYPLMLRTIQNPPYVLYYRGRLAWTTYPGLAVVGARNVTAYGKACAAYFARELSRHFVIVSGMAKGVDGIAHRNARRTIAVLGSGIDVVYPACHQELYEHLCRHHLVCSEYPPHTRPAAYHFPWRNRLIAGLAQGVVVIEAAKKSGTMITAGYAAEQGKTVFAVPGRITDPAGCLELIRDGAAILADPADVYRELNIKSIDIDL